MNRIHVTSSMIASIGYNEDKQELEIRFKRDGSIFTYYDVPSYIFNQFINSQSKGSFFHNYIKDVYDFD